MEIRNSSTIVNLGEKTLLDEKITLGSNCKKITIGYGCFIGENVYIDVPELVIGDYTTIHKNTTIHGSEKCEIGHNCWIGQNTIIDSIGGMKIGNNVGIGTYSQLWSHMKFGDMLNGCRWNTKKKMVIEDDVWFVGHCIVSPVHAKKGSMAMLGSLVVKDMEENEIYAGSPAKNVKDKMGTQFSEIGIKEKKKIFKNYYKSFILENSIREADLEYEELDEVQIRVGNTRFNLEERSYWPTRSDYEYKFMKYILYDKAKFIPVVK
ncbi:hypothetical protein GWK08_07365 [Leptobacterium flavescens]|uniref:Acyltransferase n=1 Tax=Leptobacterium flavescens TaxID=472055 RepID=A0A6P0UQW1_9FLAO|nr:hypothetical protein [Leptobacterium flavescens]NER13253.1 hypothetical protein [Leptobacterium flavescens]